MTTFRHAALVAALALGTVGAQAALVNRGGGMVYDTTLNLTWLADMNHAFTSGYAASGVAPDSTWDSNAIWTDGCMGWDAANNWANNLVYGGFGDWRLPTLNSSDTSCSDSWNPGGGFPTQYGDVNCTGGELSHLFVADLGNRAWESVLNQTGDTATQVANLALFSNVQSYAYWSGLVYAPYPSDAWLFNTYVGSQVAYGRYDALYAVAVRPGDVAAPVPEPQSLALVLLAAGAALLVGKRRPV